MSCRRSSARILHRRRTATRPVLCVGLMLALLGSSGCVYWRLSRLRGQLAQFASYFTVEEAPVVTITFLNPVLKPGDVAWLIGLPPGQTNTDGTNTEQIWDLKKRKTLDPESESLARVALRVHSRGNRMTRVSLPERFSRVIDQDTLEKAFAQSDAGPVDRELQQTGWSLSSGLGIPDESEIRAVLGSPCERTDTATHRIIEYAFDLLRDGIEPGEGPADAHGRFVFGLGHGRLVGADVRLGRLIVRVKSHEGRDYRVTVRRGKRA